MSEVKRPGHLPANTPAAERLLRSGVFAAAEPSCRVRAPSGGVTAPLTAVASRAFSRSFNQTRRVMWRFFIWGGGVLSDSNELPETAALRSEPARRPIIRRRLSESAVALLSGAFRRHESGPTPPLSAVISTLLL
ncbi:hypothetical protein EYF80_064662 [Liparis tanakae]|uniref:Uncharacterized protein n=1 Tax=Liparis tanakae TaxID=230148 RepID=A0A4Z2E9G3_9TELE|nr:hypothetical protein EYF80_064662 [Liparis tanakae]